MWNTDPRSPDPMTCHKLGILPSKLEVHYWDYHSSYWNYITFWYSWMIQQSVFGFFFWVPALVTGQGFFGLFQQKICPNPGGTWPESISETPHPDPKKLDCQSYDFRAFSWSLSVPSRRVMVSLSMEFAEKEIQIPETRSRNSSKIIQSQVFTVFFLGELVAEKLFFVLFFFGGENWLQRKPPPKKRSELCWSFNLSRRVIYCRKTALKLHSHSPLFWKKRKSPFLCVERRGFNPWTSTSQAWLLQESEARRKRWAWP